MYTRIVAVLSGVIFASAAIMAAIVTDLHDRTFPAALDIRARATLDFSRTGWTDATAFSRMAQLDRDLQLVVYKVAPDTRVDRDGQLFVGLGALAVKPVTIPRFGAQADSRLEGNDALAHSLATGEYLIGGDDAAVSTFRSWASRHGIVANWSDDAFGSTLAILWRQSDFAVSVTAAVAVMIGLVLFWLAVRARGRALRVLAGASPWRIFVEDVGVLGLSMVSGALACSVAGVVIVGLTQGWAFVPFYARCVGAFAAVILAVSVGAAAIMSIAAWPNAQVLVRRRPAVEPLRKVATLVKAAAFIMVIVSVGPALSAYADSSLASRQQSTWRALADQVSISFPASGGEDLFATSGKAFDGVVGDAEKSDAVALSYTITSDPQSGVDLGREAHVSVVNATWLDVVSRQAGADAAPTRADPGALAGLVPVQATSLSHEVKTFLDRSLPIWVRQDDGSAGNLAKFRFYRWNGPLELPAINGGTAGDLAFLSTALVVVVPDLVGTFTDDFLMSAASTQNLVFTGVAPTESLLTRHGLGSRLLVKLVAEEGVLRAQYTAYFAWLRGLTVVAMVMALCLATVIGAVISAVTNARRDFAVRLSGATWRMTLRRRLCTEWLGGIALALGVVAFTARDQVALVAGVALLAFLLLPIAHVFAVRWSFDRVVARQF